MILDVRTFLDHGRPVWSELEALLDKMEKDPGLRLDLQQVHRYHYLYQRTSADLSRIVTFASEPEIRRYLESLVARAYGEIHETRRRPHQLSPLRWFLVAFPQAFRRRARAFQLATLITLVGAAFGGGAVSLDPSAKRALMPFAHLHGDPSERVAREEERAGERDAPHAAFASQLMTHNTRVSITTLALGMTWGVGTIVILFYNGAILGAVALDYMLAGHTVFLAGWLLPHGVVEIPAVLIAGQAGLVLAGAMVGRGERVPLRQRLRQISPDVVTLIGGVAVLLVWAGLVESYLSQHHEPAVPYAAKIAFGLVELALLTVFLIRGGRREADAT